MLAFIGPLLVVVIGLLLAGGALYFIYQHRTPAPAVFVTP